MAINKSYAIEADPINSNFDTKTHKIVRAAYDDEGTNMFVLVDKKNKKVISYSITGSFERRKFSELTESKMTQQQEKLLTEKIIRPMVKKILKENFIKNEVSKSLNESKLDYMTEPLKWLENLQKVTRANIRMSINSTGNYTLSIQGYQVPPPPSGQQWFRVNKVTGSSLSDCIRKCLKKNSPEDGIPLETLNSL